LSELFQQRRAQLAHGVGLTEHQWSVLEEISTEHFMPTMFARRRESSPAAVSKTLRQLGGKGLISVRVSKADGRQRKYELTAKGRRVMSELRESRERAIRDVWLPLDGGDVARFTAFGTLLIERLEAYSTTNDNRTSDKELHPHGQDAV
jgi:DNA-binding MarR family transcriptional regulator